MNRSLSVPTVAGAMMLLSGVLHGIQTDRWSGSERLVDAAKRIHSVPSSIGQWKATELPFDPDELRVAEAAGAFARRYERTEPPTLDRLTDSKTATSTGGHAKSVVTPVDVMLLCGHHGPVSVHPPTLCFTAAGYTQVTPQRRISIRDGNGDRAEFWTADFEKPQDGNSYRLRTYWSWHDGKSWRAPDRPRYAYAGASVLHKLYVSRIVQPAQDESVEPIDPFLVEFLPAVTETLFE